MINVETVFLGAALHGVALVLLLLFNGYSNRRANILLAVLVGLLTITMWNVFVYRSDAGRAALIIDYYLWVTPLLWAPFLYLYVGQMTKQKPANAKLVLLHSLPALLAAVTQIPIHLLADTGPGAATGTLAYNAVVIFIYPQTAAYALLSLQLLRTYRNAVKDSFSTIDAINLNWLKTVVIIFSVVLMGDMSLNIPATFFSASMPFFYNVILLAEAGAIFAIGYLSLRQPEIIAGTSLPDRHQITETKIKIKYFGSAIDQQLGRELADKLDQEMTEQKLFLRNALSLTELAEVMGLSTQNLSQVINQHRHKNFYDYVNGYRARYAADQLTRHGKVNLTRLAYDAGFNNKVSFNKAFRKYTGQTPSEFVRKQHDPALP